ncbi:hypothetical protein V8E36_006073 [Tilletia maclaganii]
MGVQGLWTLIQPVARPLRVEKLEGHRLAIDSSIWLYHFQNAMRDKEGRTLSNAHILGFLWRILKLLFYGIRPVFVFDGGAPVLKRRTLANRKTRKEGARETHARTAEKLLAAQLRAAAVGHMVSGPGLSAKAKGKRRAGDAQDGDTAESQPSGSQGIVYLDDLRGDTPPPAPAAAAPASPSSSKHSDDSDWESDSDPGQPQRTSSRGSRSPAKKKKKAQPSTIRERVEAEAQRKKAEEEAAAAEDHNDPAYKKRRKNMDWHKDQYDLPPLQEPLERITSLKASEKNDIRFATDEELRALLAQLAPEDLDTSSEAFRSLPFEMQYELVGDARLQSRGTSYKRLQSMLKTAPTAIDFSRAQVMGLKTRNELTQRVLEVTDEIGRAHIRVEGVSGGKGRVESARGKEYVLLRNDGTEGGWVLGVRTDGQTADNAIEIAEEEEKGPTKWFEDAEESMRIATRDRLKQRRKGTSAAGAGDAKENETDDPPRKPPSIVSLSDDEAAHLQLEEAIVDHRVNKGRTTTPPPRARTAQTDADLLATPASIGSSSTTGSMQDFEADAYGDLYANMSGLGNEEPGIHAEDGYELEEEIVYDERGEPIGALLSGGRAQGFGEDDDFAEVNHPQARSQQKNIIIPKRRTEEEVGNAHEASSASAATPAGNSSSKTTIPRRSTLASGKPGSAIFVGLPDSDTEDVSWMYAGSQERAAVPGASSGSSGERGDVGTNVQSHDFALDPVAQNGRSNPAPQGEADGTHLSRHRLNSSNSAATHSPQYSGQDDEYEAGTGDIVIEDHFFTRTSSPENLEQEQPQPESPAPEPPSFEQMFVEASESEEDSEPDGAQELSQEQVAKVATPETKRTHSLSPEPQDDDDAPIATPAKRARLEDSSKFPIEVNDEQEQQSEVEEDDEGDLSENERRGGIQYDSDQGADEDEADDSADRVLGPDGLPLPTREELEAFEAEDAEDLGLEGDKDEFISFLSRTKGRSLLEVQEEVEAEVANLKAQHANTRRSQEEITQQMVREIQLMLRLFGLPYITAPMEAEAQCAELVQRGLVDGIITDDSDVFLFGGTRVFKNMFNQNKVVECYLLQDLEREMGISRQKLVSLAYLLGSDYTEGLAGVGPVLAMEVLAAFFDEEAARKAEAAAAARRQATSGAAAISGDLEKSFEGQIGLIRFREWWMKVQMGQEDPELPSVVEDKADPKQLKRIRRTLQNKVHLSRDWPSKAVLDAYYTPAVDTSDEAFQWGLPDLDSLRMFLGEYLKWSVSKTDQYVLPVIEAQNKRAKDKSRQTTLDQSGFTVTSALPGGSGSTDLYAGRARPKVGSSRLQQVIDGHRRANRVAKASVGRDGVARSGSSALDALEISASGSEDEDASVEETAARRGRGRGRGAANGRGKGKGRARGGASAKKSARAPSARPEEDSIASSEDDAAATNGQQDDFTASSESEGSDYGTSSPSKKKKKATKKTAAKKGTKKASPRAKDRESSPGRGGGRSRGRGRGRGRARGSGLGLADARRMNLDDARDV